MARNRTAPVVALTLAALALAAVAPHASAAAETPAPPLWRLDVRVAPVEAPLEPTGDFVVTPVTVTAPCEATLARPGGQPVDLSVALAPSWAVAVVEPPHVRLTPHGCAGDVTTAEAALRVRASKDAPAGQPAAVEVAAGGPGFEEARNHTDVTAAFWGRVRVTGDRTSAVAPEGVAAHFPIVVANDANGAVRVRLHAEDAFHGAHVGVPAPFIVPSRAGGAAEDARTVRVTIMAPQRSGYTWAHESVTVHATAVRAEDPGAVVGAETIVLHVATDGTYVSAPVAVAAVGLLAAGGGAGAVHYRRKARR